MDASTKCFPETDGTVVWLTGLSGSGKSTLSDLISTKLRAQTIPVVQIDGDALRGGLSSDLGFGDGDRDENIRRAAEVAKLLAGQGFVVLCSLISPLTAQRSLARKIVGPCFFEVFVDCGVEEAIHRDPKGLYVRAIRGEIPQFTGISAPYEAPKMPDLRIDTLLQSKEESAETLIGEVLSQIGHHRPT